MEQGEQPERRPTRALWHRERRVAGPGRIQLRSVQTQPRRLGTRYLEVDGVPLLDLGIDCDTCAVTLSGTGHTSGPLLDDLRERLVEGFDEVDPGVLGAVEAALPAGGHSALLLEITPRGPVPLLDGAPQDPDETDHRVASPVAGYHAGPGFAAPWRLHDRAYEDFYARGLATTPPFTSPVLVHEAVVPLQDLDRLDDRTVRQYRDALAEGARCTAVAWSVLELVSDDEVVLVHYLLDGHHKVHAAATGGHTVRLLALLSHSGGLRPPSEVGQLAEALTRP